MHIINLIFKTGKIPEKFKESIVIPIYKNSGNKEEISNYRPISLINNLGKIFEKCIKDRLINFLSSNNILSENQFGFAEERSTADTMYELIKEITNELDSSSKTIAVFLDLARAFDTVSHPVLLDILFSYGVGGTVLDVFRNYLNDRTQYVKVNKTLSQPLKVNMGVPQGTVLGPILFTVYINTLCNLDIGGRVISYADDTALVFSSFSWDSVRSKLINGFNRVKILLDNIKLTLNVNKTNYIAFTITGINRPNFNSIIVNSLNQPIKEVLFTKYLGIIIDCNLKWENHIQYLCKKIRCLIHKFYQMREFLQQKLLIMFYKSLVEPLLRYGIIVWGGAYNVHLHPLKVIQNSIIKIIKKNPDSFHRTCYIMRKFVVLSPYISLLYVPLFIFIKINII